MGAERRQYTMYPQKTYAGTVETEVLPDGCIKYLIELQGAQAPTEMVVDPADANHMRGVRQLHLILNSGESGAGPDRNYVIEGDSVEAVLASISQIFRRIER